MDGEILDRLYQETKVPLDKLAYTPQFDEIHQRFVKLSGADVTYRELLDMYHDRRKRGLLPRLGRAKAR